MSRSQETNSRDGHSDRLTATNDGEGLRSSGHVVSHVTKGHAADKALMAADNLTGGPPQRGAGSSSSNPTDISIAVDDSRRTSRKQRAVDASDETMAPSAAVARPAKRICGDASPGQLRIPRDNQLLAKESLSPYKPKDRGPVGIKVSPNECSGISRRPLLFPVELHSMVLEHLWDPTNMICDIRTLKACVLTCSRWHQAARPHVFRFIIIKDHGRIRKLAAQIRNDPSIAGWIRGVRLQGVSMTDEDVRQAPRRRDDDLDRWFYKFPSVLNVHLPSIRILELFNFAQLSRQRTDCQAFADWIPDLATLSSVETLNVEGCQMPSNNIAAVIRALPRLVNVGFAQVDFTFPNVTELQDRRPVSAIDETCTDSQEPLDDVGNTASVKSSIASGEKALSQVHTEEAVKCLLFHGFPLLRSLSVANYAATYEPIDFDWWRDWLKPEVVSQSLKSFYLYGGESLPSVAKLIRRFGEDPALESLQLCIFYDHASLVESGIDISKLRRLKSLRLIGHGYQAVVPDEFLSLHHFLRQLNAPRLQEITLVMVLHDKFELLAEVNTYLGDEKFAPLKTFQVEIFDSLGINGALWKKARHNVNAMFPKMAERGILRVQEHWLPYLF